MSAKHVPHIVHLRVMINYNPIDPHIFYYSVAVGGVQKAGFFAKRKFQKHQVGKTFCPSLIYALTQDAVLEAVSPRKGRIK